MMGKMEKFVFVSGCEDQDVEEVIKLDRHLIDIENKVIDALHSFSKKGKDISTIDYEEQGKLSITLLCASFSSHTNSTDSFGSM